jgi:adenosylhomocysteine nucleosidase
MMNNMVDSSSTLICVALEDELTPQLMQGWQVIYTGVGKINASLAIAEACATSKPELIINFGTAGATTPNISGLVEVTEFKQRDMDTRGLGFDLGETPFDDEQTICFDRQGLSCGTGDSFVMNPPELKTDVVDMEAYALAKYARRKGIDFRCYKYISDNADGEAAADWSAEVRKGAEAFIAKVLMSS